MVILKNKFIFILVICILFFITIIGINRYVSFNTYKKLTEKIDKLENSSLKNSIDLTKYMYQYKPNELGISQDQITYICNTLNDYESSSENNLLELNLEQALSDVNFLFDLMKYSYGGYEYFGGSFAFENAKKNILNSLNTFTKPQINSSELDTIVFESLKFIQDGHFSINNKSPVIKYVYYSNESIQVYENKKGYYIKENGEKLFIKAINNNTEFDDYLKLSLTKEGDLCYYIGVLGKANETNTILLTLESKDKKLTKYIPLNENHIQSIKDDSCGYDYYTKKGIPVVKINRMYDVNENDRTTKLFIESGEFLKNRPVIVLDLRGNVGGNDIAPMSWFENFIGEMPQIKSNSITLYSLVNNCIGQNNIKNINYEILSPELKKQYDLEVDKLKLNYNKWYESKSNEKFHENNTKIFVLIDNNVSSSGESLISYLKTLDNTFFVGTNSSGCSLSNVFTTTKLPNSKINIKFGNSISIYDDFKEGEGYKPDIWMNDSDSLNRVLNFIDKIK